MSRGQAVNIADFQLSISVTASIITGYLLTEELETPGHYKGFLSLRFYTTTTQSLSLKHSSKMIIGYPKTTS